MINIFKYKKCPKDIQNSVLLIIEYTALEIRHCENLRVAQVLASHIHNLPKLINSYSIEELSSRWPVDSEFVKRIVKEENYQFNLMDEAWSKAGKVFDKHLKAYNKGN